MSAKRIAILYSELAGYTLACLKALKQHHEVEILVFFWPPASNAPFDFERFDWIDHAYPKNKYNPKLMEGIISDFDPHIVLISGWMDQDYLNIARTIKKRGITIVSGLDAPWKGSFKQRVLAMLGPVYLKRSIDVFWVTGDRQAQYANKLGYRGHRLRHGLYCCNWDHFATSYFMNDEKAENAFLFVGRYISIKGIHVLLEAYHKYRKSAENPWKLYCAGAGELKEHIENSPEVQNLGFVQPEDLPELMQRCSAFVLPSLSEPWGVVIQEAAAAGLPVICSDVCGAVPHLVQDGYNGYIFESGDANHLTDCMIKMSKLTAIERSCMADNGFELSKQFRPERWAQTLMDMIEQKNWNENKVPH